MVYAGAKGLGTSSNIEEEFIAIKEALEYYSEKNIEHLILETNSLSLKYIILK